MRWFSKKQLWVILIILFSTIVTSSTIFFSTKFSSQFKKNHNSQLEEFITIKINGYVDYPGSYSFKKGVTYKEVLQKAGYNKNSDLSEFDLEKRIDKNLKIFVKAIQSNKIKWKELNDEKELIARGITKSIASKIINLRKAKVSIEWTDLEDISGIGPKTLEKLKKILIL
ncbi:MAG0490 family ComEA-like DNA-binding protein [Mycoplasmopsis hyopharyngis]|uniref:MAG0490 family ComEA-like DNA-binding protein n=1 Tax=Mycoplasmopsis hyopharyngis TaxID=29558 RepID=UPI003872AFF4